MLQHMHMYVDPLIYFHTGGRLRFLICDGSPAALLSALSLLLSARLEGPASSMSPSSFSSSSSENMFSKYISLVLYVNRRTLSINYEHHSKRDGSLLLLLMYTQHPHYHTLNQVSMYMYYSQLNMPFHDMLHAHTCTILPCFSSPFPLLSLPSLLTCVFSYSSFWSER